jgi:hypothetical protein
MMNDELYQRAIDALMLEPERLTQEQIDRLTSVDDQLGARATKKRAEALARAATARHRAAMGEPPERPKQYRFDPQEVVSATVDTITISLAQPRGRIKALEAAKATLEERCAALERRVLEIEATIASFATVPHGD